MINTDGYNWVKFQSTKVCYESFTDQEKEIIQLIGKGLTNKQIAKDLFTSESFIARNETLILHKLGVKDRLNLVIYAYQNNLLKTSH